MSCRLFVAVVAVVCAWFGNTRDALHADVILFQLPGTRLAMVLPEGEAKVQPGKSVAYRIPEMGTLTLSLETSQIIKSPSRKQLFQRQFGQAQARKSIDEILDSARFALRNGLLEEFKEAATAAHRLEPQHPSVQRMIKAHQQIKQKLPEASAAAAKEKMLQLVPRKDMKFEVSDHYIVMHDTDDEQLDRKKRTRAKKRLELMEMVYASFFYKFALEGELLPAPKEHLMVLLFGHEQDYLHYATLLDPKLKQSAGFWSSKTNVAVYYDQGTTPHHVAIRKAADQYQRVKDDLVRGKVRGSRDIVQFANALDKIVEISREQADISVVSHEATHQLAGNTGLLPMGKLAMSWAHEGLATYFETPQGAGWGGIGAVNEERLDWYKILQSRPQESKLEFLVSDNVFDLAKSHEAQVAAYGQAWALTHFLMETRFMDLIKYYRTVAALEMPEEGIPRNELVNIFKEIFGELEPLESEWRAYMRRLKTDTDRLLEKL